MNDVSGLNVVKLLKLDRRLTDFKITLQETILAWKKYFFSMKRVEMNRIL